MLCLIIEVQFSFFCSVFSCCWFSVFSVVSVDFSSCLSSFFSSSGSSFLTSVFSSVFSISFGFSSVLSSFFLCGLSLCRAGAAGRYIAFDRFTNLFFLLGEPWWQDKEKRFYPGGLFAYSAAFASIGDFFIGHRG